jgi:hypothetical protein
MTSRLRTNLAILGQRAAASPKSEPMAPPPPSTRRDTTLDELIDTLPDGAVSAFTKSIQPILVNGCAAAACHGVSSKSDWRLLRIDTRQAASRYATLRNLEATLKLIDGEQPERSPLLTVPKAPHATAKEAVFNTRNLAQVEQLEAWVNRVSGRPSGQARIDKAGSTAPPDGGKTSVESPPADPFNPDEFNNSPASRRVTSGGSSKTSPN